MRRYKEKPNAKSSAHFHCCVERQIANTDYCSDQKWLLVDGGKVANRDVACGKHAGVVGVENEEWKVENVERMIPPNQENVPKRQEEKTQEVAKVLLDLVANMS